MKGFRTTGDLFPLTEEQAARYPEMKTMMKGLIDIRSAVDSEEVVALKNRLTQMSPDDIDAFFEELGLFATYAHGTHVSGIAAEGNPAVRILTTRITFDYKNIPDRPTLEESVRYAREAKHVADYFRAHDVRVVNMSWGGNQRGIEGSLEANGMGDDSNGDGIPCNCLRGSDHMYNGVAIHCDQNVDCWDADCCDQWDCVAYIDGLLQANEGQFDGTCCQNNLDDDSDGLIDGADPQCESEIPCRTNAPPLCTPDDCCPPDDPDCGWECRPAFDNSECWCYPE